MPDIPRDIDLQRRQLMLAGTALAGAAFLPLSACGRTEPPAPTASSLPPPSSTVERTTMGLFTTKDDVQIYFKDWGPKDGPVVTLSHGWPLNADSWESQMYHLAANGCRVIAHDRRGHGRSSQPWDGNDMDHYADDLAAVVEALALKEAVHVGHSTGGGETKRQSRPCPEITTSAIGGTAPSAPSASVMPTKSWRNRLGFATSVTR